MARAGTAVLACIGLLLTGCIGGDDEARADEDLAADTPAGLVPGEIIEAPPAPTRDPAPSLAHAPEWQLGEWWKVRMTEDFEGESYEVTRVVAGFEDGQYLLAMPRDEFSDPVMVLHVPGFGHADAQDLSFEVHDVDFQPLQFPLTEGATWETAWQNENNVLTATVHVVSPTVAEIDLTSDNTHMVATYDATVREISKLVIDGYGTVEVIDHGMDYEGIVTVPHQHDLVFFHGRVAGVLSLGLEPALPIEDIEVDTTYDRVSFIVLSGSVVAPGAPGVYTLRAISPDGTEYMSVHNAAEKPGINIENFGHDDPGGVWQLTHGALGPGLVLFEGIAYHQYDVSLPSGCILPAEGEHEHGDAGCQA